MKDILIVISDNKEIIKQNEYFFVFFENSNYEIHFWIVEENIDFHPEFSLEALGFIEEDIKMGSSVILVSDSRSIITFSYRMFNRCFSEFIWIPKEKESIIFEGIYEQIADLNSIKNDDLEGEMILYCEKVPFFETTMKFVLSFENYSYFKVFTKAEDIILDKRSVGIEFSEDKEYRWAGERYFLGESKYRKVIILDDESVEVEFQMTENALLFLIQEPLMLEWVLNRDNNIEIFKKDILSVSYEIYTHQSLSKNDLRKVINLFEKYLGVKANGILIFIYSILVKRYKEEKDISEFLDFLATISIDLNELRFIYCQMQFLLFSLSYSISLETETKWYRLYKRIVNMGLKVFRNELSILHDCSQKNKDHILIICGQFLAEQHAPTRRAMDYSLIYHHKLGKKVRIINTAEFMRTIPIHYFQTVLGNYKDSYNSEKFMQMTIEGEEFAFYQMQDEYRNREEIGYLFRQIRDFDPEYIFVVNGSNLLADLISRYIPTSTIECGYSMPVIFGGYRIMSREIEEKDRKFARAVDIDENTMIESFITFKKPKSENKKLEKNKEEFVICIVSNRINRELSEEMIELCDRMLEIDPMIKIKIFGIGFDSEKLSLLSLYPHRYFYEGFQEDILSAYTGCDAYYNLKRYGGGSSVGQAMLMGLPIVSHRFGDGSYVLGRNRCFDSSEDLILEVERLVHDKEYYDESKRYSLKRAEEIFDTERMIRNVDKNIREKIATDFRYARTV